MALFTIRRFQGDRIIENVSNTTNQQTLLEKLQQKIKSRSESNNDPKNNEEKHKKECDEIDDLEIKKRKHSNLTADFKTVKESRKKQKNDTKTKSVDEEVVNNNVSLIKNKQNKTKHSSKKKKCLESEKSNLNDDIVKLDIDERKVEERVDDTTENEESDMEEEKSEEEGAASFTVLGNVESKKKKKVQRVLPDWLAQPTVVDHDIKRNQTPITSMKGLDQRMVASLLENDINYFFPVQSTVIPVVLASLKYGPHIGNVGYRPRDICVSAPTGSGKTLAFVIPVVQALLDRVVPQIRALVVLPTKELADQVFNVFSTYCRKTSLKLVLIGGTKSFSKEQELLVRHRPDGSFSNLVDIIVATPGRLVDHINLTKGFTLQHLRFLVIDEADRMMDNISKNWITEVERSAYPGGECRPVPGMVTPASVSTKFPPLQKLLFSATLSQNPEKLTQLNLFFPELLTSVIKTKAHEETNIDKGEFVGKYTTPVELTEFMINCTAGEKPLMVLHLIVNLCFSNVLCFTNTVEETHRLYLLLKAVGGINVEEFSSLLSKKKRAEILKKFKAGKIQILISSDAMARGMDVENVCCVISYDVPPFIKTYIHRVGRTARAGRGGIAFSLVQKSGVTKFKGMLSNVGKDDIQIHKVKKQHLASLEQRYEDALSHLKSMLKEEKVAQYTV